MKESMAADMFSLSRMLGGSGGGSSSSGSSSSKSGVSSGKYKL